MSDWKACYTDSKPRLVTVFGIKLSNEDIAEIEGLRDVAIATNFGTTLTANGLRREITTWGFRIKDGLFSVNPCVCWSLSLDS